MRDEFGKLKRNAAFYPGVEHPVYRKIGNAWLFCLGLALIGSPGDQGGIDEDLPSIRATGTFPVPGLSVRNSRITTYS